jgi:8-oxo-dGTP pyrophosphatase MutT (NUDIX family)
MPIIPVYVHEPLPTIVQRSIFLAGPTPRSQDVKGWRNAALKLLERLDFNGHVFIPEERLGQYRSDDYLNQVEWETSALNMADQIVFWVPREMTAMPALTTNIEWGMWGNSGKVVLGYPPKAASMRYFKWQADKFKVPVFNNLEATLQTAVNRIGAGAVREGAGAAKVPLHIWKNATFQAWYEAQTEAGNRLDEIEVVWNFKSFLWAVRVSIWVGSEQRHKSNEVFIGRPDIVSVVAYWTPKSTTNPFADTRVVMVREFRSAACTPTGFIKELPSGSIGEDSLKSAVMELQEETGLHVDSARLVPIATLQLAGTLLAHTSSVYALKITDEELQYVRACSATKKVFGVDDEERTQVCLYPVRDIISDTDTFDWSTIGMVLSAVHQMVPVV